MSDEQKITDLMESVIDLLKIRQDDAEIIFNTLVCICADIALANDMNKHQFMSFCLDMYNARKSHDGEVVH